MVEWLVNMLNVIGNGVGKDVLDILVKTPQEAASSAYKFATDCNEGAVKPVASTLLSIFFVMELSRVSTKIDGDRQLGVKIVGATMLKFALILTAATNAQNILTAIYGITQKILNGFKDNYEGSGGFSICDNSCKIAIEKQNSVSQAATLVMLFLPFIAAIAVTIAFRVVIVLRFFEIFLFISFAALPVAFFASDDTKGMAINFYRKFAAVCLKSSTLLLGVFLYRKIAYPEDGSESIIPFPGKFNGGNLPQYVISNYGNFFISGIVLFSILAISNTVAKAGCGE